MKMNGCMRLFLIFSVVFLLVLAVTPVSAEDEVKFDVDSWEGLKQVIDWSNLNDDNRSKQFTINITNNAVIHLQSELEIKGNVTIQPKQYTQKSIESPVGSHAFNVTGSLTFFESPSGGTSSTSTTLVIFGASGNDKSLVRVGEGGTFTLKGGILEKSKADKGGAVFIDGGSFIMSGGVIQDNTATKGGGVYMVDGTFTQTGGGIKGNKAENGGGVYMEKGTYSMEGGNGELHNNQASTDGGGLYINDGTFTLKGKKIDGNTAAGNGGGIFVNDGEKVVIENGDISNNQASGNGGGIFINGQEVEMKKGNFYNNNAKHGGAVYINNAGFWMEKGNIYDNKASGNGGAVYINHTSFWMDDGSLYQNSAEIGSAVYLNRQLFTMKGGSIHSNTAAQAGGVVYVGKNAEGSEGNMFQMWGGSITNNHADLVGGVIVEGRIELHGSPVIAENTGPDLYLIDTTLIIPYEGGQDVVGLTDGARIGIAHSGINQENPTLVAKGDAEEDGKTSNYISHNYLKYIFSDAENYKVIVDGRQLYLAYDPPEPQGSSTWLTPVGGSYALYTGTLTNGGTVNFPGNSPVQGITLPEGVAGEVIVSTEKDPELPTPSGTVYRQFDVSAPALPVGTTATIGISIPASDIPAGQGVSVLHYQGADRGWVREPTTATVNGDTVRIIATVSGFSPFAVVFEEGGAIPMADEDIAPPLSGADITATPAESPAPILGILAGLCFAGLVKRRG